MEELVFIARKKTFGLGKVAGEVGDEVQGADVGAAPDLVAVAGAARPTEAGKGRGPERKVHVLTAGIQIWIGAHEQFAQVGIAILVRVIFRTLGEGTEVSQLPVVIKTVAVRVHDRDAFKE